MLQMQKPNIFYLATAKSLKDGLSFPHLLYGENNSSALLWCLRVLKEMVQRALSTEPNGWAMLKVPIITAKPSSLKTVSKANTLLGKEFC